MLGFTNNYCGNYNKRIKFESFISDTSYDITQNLEYK